MKYYAAIAAECPLLIYYNILKPEVPRCQLGVFCNYLRVGPVDTMLRRMTGGDGYVEETARYTVAG